MSMLSEMARFREYVNLHYAPSTAERVYAITIRYQRYRLDELPDAECQTTASGECVAVGPCLHT